MDTFLGMLFCVFSGAWLIAKNCLPTIGDILLPTIGWTLWLAAGALAATAAELLKKPVLPHALLGLCLPYIYPVLLVRSARKNAAEQQVREEKEIQQVHEEQKSALASRFRTMHEKREQERRERIAERQGISVEDVPVRQEAPEPEPGPEPAAAAAPEAKSEIYEILYAQPVAEDGSRPGPFQFTLAAGGTLDVDAVRDLAPQFMTCTISGSGKSVRIRYDQVAAVARYE